MCTKQAEEEIQHMTLNSIREFYYNYPCHVPRDLQKQRIIQLAMQTHYIHLQLLFYTLLIMYSKESIDVDAHRQKGLNSE